MPGFSSSGVLPESWAFKNSRGSFRAFPMPFSTTFATAFVLSCAVLTLAADRDLVAGDDDFFKQRNNSALYDRRKIDDGDPNAMACELAYHKCSNRDGCKTVLGYYIEACEDLQGGWTTECSVQCRRALIGLTSTEEGKLFMQCRCSEDRCRVLKERILACKPAVESALRDPDGLSCLDAEMVCEADSPCGKALQYYRHRCRKLFHGVKCNRNCLNSLLILRRQEKAGPLKTCRCDGTESYDCLKMRTDMERLCFPAPAPGATESEDDEENRLDASGGENEEDDESEGEVHNHHDVLEDDYGDYSTASKKVQFPYSVSLASRKSGATSWFIMAVVFVAWWR